MHKTDRFYNSKWGIFNHLFFALQLTEEEQRNKTITEFVDGIDTDLIAEQLHELGVGYYFVSMFQANQYMNAPNATFDRIAGYQSGEACSKTDLIEKLYASLSKYGIDLYLYFDGDGPWRDPKSADAFGFRRDENARSEGFTLEFFQKFSMVLEEYAVRYGDKVKGWWFDSCYDYFNVTDEMLGYYKRAVEKGNPNAIVAMNNGGTIRECEKGLPPTMKRHSVHDDYVSGEATDFSLIPDGRFVDGAQWHVFSWLGWKYDRAAWAENNLKYSGEFLGEYIKLVNQRGGVVTIDIKVYPDGSFDKAQMDELKKIQSFVGRIEK